MTASYGSCVTKILYVYSKQSCGNCVIMTQQPVLKDRLFLFL